jgi:trk system potassium uptake protein TrkH
MKTRNLVRSPLLLPVVFFAVVIFIGGLLLHSGQAGQTGALSWTDAFFTSTSATCVTGLSVVDTGSFFTRWGQVVIFGLMQAGGLGIMTFTSLALYLWRRRVSFTDRIAVGQSLLHDPGFALGRFLIQLFCVTFLIELLGALLLFWQAPDAFTPFSAIFHAVSAFCNAGFSLFNDSLMAWKGDWGVNLTFIALIFLGGIGFSVLIEWQPVGINRFKSDAVNVNNRLSWYTRTVVKTSLFLILLGWVLIYFAEFVGYHRMTAPENAVLSALFQSVTCRTAGFNTLNISEMTNVSLFIMLGLMFIGGAPGSCAGGVKVTTFRVLIAAAWSQLRGRRQSVIGKFAISEDAVKKAFVLFVFAVAIVFIASFMLDFTEGGDQPHDLVRGQFLEILFETVSAFGTVGLSTGITPTLSAAGKWILIVLMLVGRLGPLVLISAVQAFQKESWYTLPEKNPMIG